MALETTTTIAGLVASNPSGADQRRTADDHVRLIKRVLQATFGTSMDEPLTIKASILNRITNFLTPLGAIVAFGLPLDLTPVGWAPCDGREVDRSDGSGKITTPDLRGRAIAGWSDVRPQGTAFGQASRTVTTEAAGAHNPSGTVSVPGVPDRNVSFAGRVASAIANVTRTLSTRKVDDGGSASGIVNGVTINDPGHDHEVNLSATIAGTGAQTVTLQMDAVAGHGHQVTVNLEQPTITLHFIMKI